MFVFVVVIVIVVVAITVVERELVGVIAVGVIIGAAVSLTAQP